MRRMLEDLCDLLREQKKLLEGIFELSLEERQVIIDGNSERLEEIVRLKFKELSRLNAAERKRAAAAAVLAGELGLSEISISAVAERAEPEDRLVLKGLQKELTNLLKRQSDINTENRELIEMHLEYSDSMLNLMVDSEDPLNNFYGGDGRETPERKRSTGFFDGQI